MQFCCLKRTTLSGLFNRLHTGILHATIGLISFTSAPVNLVLVYLTPAQAGGRSLLRTDLSTIVSCCSHLLSVRSLINDNHELSLHPALHGITRFNARRNA